MLADSRRKAVARGHVGPHGLHQIPQLGVVQPVRDDIEGLNERYARLHHGGHLAREQGDVTGCHLAACGAEFGQDALGLPGDLARVDPLLAQLDLDRLRIHAGDRALGLLSGAIGPFVDVYGALGHDDLSPAGSQGISGRGSRGSPLPGW